MKRVIAAIVASLVLMTTEAFAGNGDLVVDGKVMIGSADSLSLPNSATITLGSTWGTGALYFNNGVSTFGQWGTSGLITSTGIRSADNGIPNSPAYGFRDSAGMGLFRPADNALGFATVNQERMRITSNGNVGIGTMTPDSSYKLTVEGSALARTGYWQGSDARLKKNMLPLTDALSKVMKLEGKSFEWKEELYTTQETPGGPEVIKNRRPVGVNYGVIAQEIEKVLPELVKEDAEGIKAVSYTGIIPVLIEAIKEQQKDIEQLKKKVANLQQ